MNQHHLQAQPLFTISPNIAYIPSFSLFQQIGVVSSEKENSFFKLELNEVIYTETTK